MKNKIFTQFSIAASFLLSSNVLLASDYFMLSSGGAASGKGLAASCSSANVFNSPYSTMSATDFINENCINALNRYMASDPSLYNNSAGQQVFYSSCVSEASKICGNN